MEVLLFDLLKIQPKDCAFAFKFVKERRFTSAKVSVHILMLPAQSVLAPALRCLVLRIRLASLEELQASVANFPKTADTKPNSTAIEIPGRLQGNFRLR